METTLKVSVTGAAGQISYILLPIICSGHVFGENRRLQISLLDIPSCEDALRGIVMELKDCNFPLVDKIEYSTNPSVAFKDVQMIIFLGACPRKPGMERKDLIQINANIFIEQGKAVNDVADPDCKLLVIANPANTNCYVLQKYATKIPLKNFTSLSRLDHNRAISLVSSFSMQAIVC